MLPFSLIALCFKVTFHNSIPFVNLVSSHTSKFRLHFILLLQRRATCMFCLLTWRNLNRKKTTFCVYITHKERWRNVFWWDGCTFYQYFNVTITALSFFMFYWRARWWRTQVVNILWKLPQFASLLQSCLPTKLKLYTWQTINVVFTTYYQQNQAHVLMLNYVVVYWTWHVKPITT